MFILPKILNFKLGTYAVRGSHQNPTYQNICVGKEYVNFPVNTRLIETVKRGIIRNSTVPDATVYTIEFHFQSNMRLWFFETRAGADKEWARLLDLYVVG